jgi:hypothetical protein
MMKSFRTIGVPAAFLLLGLTAPAYSRQERQDKPQKEQQAKTPQQKEQKPQQQATAPRQQQQQRPQQQATAPRQQQQQKPQQQAATSRQQEQQRPPQQAATSRQQQATFSQRPQRTQQAMAVQRAQPALRLSARGNGRIPDDRFRSNFGRGHFFRIGTPVMVGGYSRFQYDGFWFGFVEPWPAEWYYTDDVYIDYVDGGYYMYDPYYPGTRFAISVVL